MNEIHPPLERDPSLPAQLLHSVPQCSSRSLVVARCLCLFRMLSSRREEHRPIEVLCEVGPIQIRHCPHRADHAAEPTILCRSGKVQALVGGAPVRQLGRVACREEGEFGGGKTSAHDFEQGEALTLLLLRVSVELESGIEGFSGLQRAVTYKVDEWVVPKAL